MSGFRHDAFFYGDTDEFLEGTLAFLREGLEADEAALVVVERRKIDLLREALNGDADAVAFADMAEVGTNPARIIPAWRDFLDAEAAGGRPVRGIGEPVWPGRSDPEVAECQRHEALLNLAFADAEAFWLRCPYDTTNLAPDVIAAAHRSHPQLVHGAHACASEAYAGLAEVSEPFGAPLAEPPAVEHELAFGLPELPELRALVGDFTSESGASPRRARDFTLAVSEIATNSIRHGGGDGRMRLWREPRSVVCEIRDGGRLTDPLAGRVRPVKGQLGGYGLWMANQLCELVQVRVLPEGTTTRMHLRLT